MANISEYLAAILNARKGKDVRGSIHDAIEVINDVAEKSIDCGTAISSTSSPTTGYYEDSLYINTTTDDLWKCNGSGWVLCGNLKGRDGNFYSSWKGRYETSVQYHVGDIVYQEAINYNGASYVCLQDCVGKNPITQTAYWQRICTDGTTVTFEYSYAISDTSTRPTSWQSEVPTPEKGKYLWTRIKISTLKSAQATETYTYLCDYIGQDGNATIDDSANDTIHVWSSQKTNNEVTALTAKLSNYEQNGFLSNNLLNPTLQTTTQNGITCTNNGDGTYTLNGTTSENTSFIVATLRGNEYANLRLVGTPTNSVNAEIYSREANESSIYIENIHDFGSGVQLTNAYEHRICIYIPANKTCSNLLFKPMVTSKLSASYSDYTQYALPNTEITQRLSNSADYLKGKNLIDDVFVVGGINASTGANQDGVTDRKRCNKYYEVNATDTYTFSIKENLEVRIYVYDSSKSPIILPIMGVMYAYATKNVTLTMPSGARYIRLVVVSTSFTEPMLEIGASASSYVPYTKSNVELTSDVATISDELSDITTIKQGICTSNFTIGSMNKVTKIGNLCELVLIVTVDSATANSTPIFNIPSGFCPVEVIQDIVPVSSSGDATKGIQIEKNGTVKSMSNISSSTLFRIHLVYLSA